MMDPSVDPIKILVADDDDNCRELFSESLPILGNYIVVAHASDGWATVRLALTLTPDIVLMDLKMPDIDGIEATRQITARKKNIKILLLSGYANPELMVQARQAGASGYILKCSPLTEVTRAIDTIAAGHLFFGEAMHLLLPDTALNPPIDERAPLFKTLSDCERPVLALIGECRAPREIAKQLNISSNTVYTHCRHIKEKLHIHSNSDLTRYAIHAINKSRP
jgi:DNA-binding NarL/FixJ family response regulator